MGLVSWIAGWIEGRIGREYTGHYCYLCGSETHWTHKVARFDSNTGKPVEYKLTERCRNDREHDWHHISLTVDPHVFERRHTYSYAEFKDMYYEENKGLVEASQRAYDAFANYFSHRFDVVEDEADATSHVPTEGE